MSNKESFSLKEVRWLALQAQGFGRPCGRCPGPDGLKKCLQNLGVLQIDSVNVLVRAHYLPAFSRHGVYSRSQLDEMAWGKGKKRQLFEYWGHEASLLPLSLYPLMAWRMKKAAAGEGIYKGLAEFGRQEKTFIGKVLNVVGEKGPLSASELGKGGAKGPWWGWSREKTALEWLFAAGLVSVNGRRSFERLYYLTEKVLPAEILNQPEPGQPEAQRKLIILAAKALGLATEKDLRDYYRLPPADSKAAVADLLAEGELREARVESWAQPAYIHKDAKAPKKISAQALISPFDSLIWERDRTERLFNFRYRLEFYTPPAKRIYGYHVLPFLNGDRLVARVDLKAERDKKFLRVISVFSEEKSLSEPELAALAQNLRKLAEWLELPEVTVNKKGALEKRLAEAVRSI